MVAGFFTVGLLSRWIGRQKLVNISMMFTGLSLLGLATAPLFRYLPDLPRLQALNLGHPVLLVSVVWSFILGVTNSLILVPTQTVLQDRTPEAAYGRVFANRLLIANIGGIAPIALTGLMADLVGIEWVMGGVGMVTLFIAIFGLFYLRAFGRNI
jgi:MFS family permease